MSPGPVTAYRRVLPADFYLYDGTNAPAIVEWSAGHCYQADGQLIVMTKRGDLVVEVGERVTHGLVPGDWYPIDPEAYAAGWIEHFS
jgi:hypothetical protein